MQSNHPSCYIPSGSSVSNIETVEGEPNDPGKFPLASKMRNVSVPSCRVSSKMVTVVHCRLDPPGVNVSSVLRRGT